MKLFAEGVARFIHFKPLHFWKRAFFNLWMEKAEMIFITGGARSGKSLLAEKLAHEQSGKVIYIATARTEDDEMRLRIKQHKERRPSDWQTIEAPADLPSAVAKAMDKNGTVLIDCVTVYISNRLLTFGLDAGERAGRMINGEINELTHICKSSNGNLIMVSNEVGMGIVPDNALGRAFRDIAGRANQKLAQAAQDVYLCVSGIPIKVK